MRFKFLYFSAFILLFISCNCTSDSKISSSKISSWVSPEADKSINLGDKISLQVKPMEAKPDSIVYFIDTIKMASSKNTAAVSVNSDSLALGNRALIAKIYKDGQAEEITTNLTIRSGLTPRKFTYSVAQTFPHDTSSYTEGLEYYNGFLYESDGEYGASSLRKTDVSRGKVLQLTPVEKVFAEGITIIDDKILMLTYRENIGMEYDLKTLKKIREFPMQYQREGWGLCTNGTNIYNSDGSSSIYILNKDNYMQKGYLEVFDQNGPVQQLNELEFINGSIYANIYQSDRVVIINPKNGQVTGEIDFANLYPTGNRNANANVLNGLAWDAKGKRLFVTGKKWNKLFQIEIAR